MLQEDASGQEDRAGGNPSKAKEPKVIRQLRKCGHMLHHGLVTGDDIAANLSEQESEQFASLLEKALGQAPADRAGER